MDNSGAELMIEFTHAYDDGARVFKRGLDATPRVIGKFDIGPDEVMAFSSWHGRRRAMTAFHFHPEFPAPDRRRYMEAHDEGRQAAAEAEDRLQEERRRHWRFVNDKLARKARAIARTLDMALATARF